MTDSKPLSRYFLPALFIHILFLILVSFSFSREGVKKLTNPVTVSTVNLAPKQVEQPSIPKHVEKTPEVKPQAEEPSKSPPKKVEKKGEESLKKVEKSSESLKSKPEKKVETKQEAVVSKNEVVIQKGEKKIEAKKPQATSKKEQPKADKISSSKKEDLLKKAKESLAKMGESKAPSSSSSDSKLKIPSPSKIEKSSFNLRGGEEDRYTAELIRRIKLALRLPESGQVLVDLTLRRNGKVLLVTVLESKSGLNRQYVQSTLSSIHFPDFGEWYPKEHEKIFTLSLENSLY